MPEQDERLEKCLGGFTWPVYYFVNKCSYSYNVIVWSLQYIALHHPDNTLLLSLFSFFCLELNPIEFFVYSNIIVKAKYIKHTTTYNLFLIFCCSFSIQ